MSVDYTATAIPPRVLFSDAVIDKAVATLRDLGPTVTRTRLRHALATALQDLPYEGSTNL